MRRRWSVLMVVVMLSFGRAAPCPADTVPHQFIAKTYTEALGRLPDSTGYGLSVQTFRRLGCSVENLRAWARQFYDSPMHPSLTEYASDYPKGSGAATADSIARILTLYRGILNREPTAPEFASRLQQYRGGAWSTVLESVLGSGEFTALAPRICNQDFYGFSGPQFPAIDVPFVRPAFEVVGCSAACSTYGQCRSDVPDPDALQTAIYCASQEAGPGGTAVVELAPQAVFRLNSTLLIPGNVTVRTRTPTHGWEGFPPTRYALMTRLVRASNFGGALVRLNRVSLGGVAVGHARLQNVWVEGHRGPVQPSVPDLNIALSGGNGAEISGCRVNDSAGWTNILVQGMSAGAECEQVSIVRNLITEYTSCHYKPDAPAVWTDGISTSCENTLIEDNQIADVTDVGIVIFGGTESTTQRSVARGNSLLSAGNAAWAALAADPVYGAYSREFDFTGTRFENNSVWTGDGHYDIALMVGTAAQVWPGAPHIGRGAAFVNNSVGWPALACSARVDIGIAVSGMMNATVTGNRLGLTLTNLGDCPDVLSQCGLDPPPSTAAVVASRCAGLASGTIQDALDFKISRCLGHAPPHPDCASGLNVGGTSPGELAAGSGLSVEAVFPNPTRGDILVRFNLPSAEKVRLELLDVTGRRVAYREVDGRSVGRDEVALGGSGGLRPGVYLVKVSQGHYQEVRRVVVVH